MASPASRGPSRRRPPPRRPRRPRRPLWKRLLGTGLIAVLTLALLGAVGFVVAYAATDVPDPNEDFQTQTTKVSYRDGKTALGTFAEQNRESVALAKVPKHVQDAVIAAEDRTFYTNQGIDPKGILRAAFSNARGNSTQGASTITQQYVKILYLTSERSLTRKAKEAFVSLKLQRQTSKEQILEGYLNTIYFGRGAYGIQAAAQAYFDKDVSDLTVAEGAVLASVLNSPSNLDPAEGEDAAARLLGRYRYVLGGMASMGNLDSSEATRLEQRLPTFPVIKKTQQYAGQNGFMLEMVKKELRAKGFADSDIDGGGLRITTTFSKPVMRDVRDGVLEQKPDGLKGLHIGAVSIDVKTGAVRGIYGGQDYLASAFNWAAAGAQPGSSFKPFAAAAAIEDGYSIKDTFDGNSPYELPDGTEVKNEGGGRGTSYGSRVSMIKAMEDSINTAFIDMTLGMKDGPQKIKDMADRLGIPVDQTSIQANTGISLGSERVSAIDMANAYATIADGGREKPWHVVQKVTRAADGKTLYEAPTGTKEAVSADIADDVSYLMQQVVRSGTGTAAASIGRPAAGKTGTATNDKDQVSSAWFVGYTPQLATAVMYVRGDGNDQLDGWLPSYFGGSYPARTWAAIMSRAMDGEEVEDFPPPAYVDGDAPSTGHQPVPTRAPEPPKTRKPKPTQAPAPTTSAPPSTSAPSPTPPPTTPPPATTPPVGQQGQGNGPGKGPGNGKGNGPGGGNGPLG